MPLFGFRGGLQRRFMRIPCRKADSLPIACRRASGLSKAATGGTPTTVSLKGHCLACKPAAAKNAPSQVFGRERLLAATLVKRGKTACRSRVRGASAAIESKVVEQTSAANRSALTNVWNKPDVAIRQPIALAGAVPLYWPFAHRASYTHPTRRISCREYARPPRAVPFPHITGIHISMPIHFLFDFACEFRHVRLHMRPRRIGQETPRQPPWNGGMDQVLWRGRGTRHAILTIDYPAIMLMGRDQTNV